LQHLLNNDARLDPFWRNRFIYFEQIDTVAPEAGSHLIQSLAITLERLREFYRLSSPIYPDLLQITRWPAELFMPAHVDNATSDGSYCPTHYRRYSCVIYLNDDYEGGEVFFTAQKALVRPKRGMLLACQSGFKHEKAFLKVTSGTQLTMTSFATFDPRAGHFGLQKRLSALKASAAHAQK
jgi:hypothetical protein